MPIIVTVIKGKMYINCQLIKKQLFLLTYIIEDGIATKPF